MLFSLNKLLRCLFPMRALYKRLSRKSGSVLTGVVWGVALMPAIEYYALDRGYLYDTDVNRSVSGLYHDHKSNYKSSVYTGIILVIIEYIL